MMGEWWYCHSRGMDCENIRITEMAKSRKKEQKLFLIVWNMDILLKEERNEMMAYEYEDWLWLHVGLKGLI